MDAEEDILVRARSEMIERQLRARGITSQAVLGAFAHVPRHVFVPRDFESQAYTDRPLPIGCGQTISQPYIVALMLEALDVQPGHKVLDVGAGSGYQTALLSRLARHVFACERIEALTERAMAALASLSISNITVCTLDGSLGWPEEAPFDRIVCGAAAPDVPQPWIDQLVDGGRIVVPIGGPQHQEIIRLDKCGNRVVRRQIGDVQFVPLIGRAGWPDQAAG